MSHRPPLVAALVLAVVLAACGGDGDDGPTPRTACNYGGYCNEYEGAELDVLSTDALCTHGGGTAMSACPAEEGVVLGLCTRLRDGTTIRGYYYDPAIVDVMRDACIALGDAWTTP